MRIRKLLLLLLILSSFLLGCKKQHRWNFQIIGHIDNAPASTYARLYLALPTGNQLIDSVQINSQGNFILHARVKDKNFYTLTFTNSNYNIYLLLDSGETVNITADYNDILNTYDVEGSQDSKLIQVLEQHLSQTRRRLDSLTFIYERLVHKGKKDSAQLIDSMIKLTLREQKLYSTRFVLEHLSSLVALPALSQVYVPGKGIFDPENDAQLYFKVDSALSRHYPRNPHVLRMHSFVQNIKLNMQRHQFSTNNISPGSKAPDFTAKTLNGQSFKLSDNKGRKVYLLFMASWCEDCQQTVSWAQKTNSPDLVKIAIMLDIDKDKARTYATKHLKGFLVVCDQKFWNSPIVRLYHVTRLPAEFLISPDGKIIAMGKEVHKNL